MRMDPFKDVYRSWVSNLDTQFLYCAWRMTEWLKGGKTYRQIDEAVESGELVPILIKK